MDSGAGASSLLARIASSTTFDQLPLAAVQAAKWSLLDALGVMLGASGLESACIPFAWLASDFANSGQGCLLIGTSARAPAPLAAMANGALAHALDFEDAYDGAPVHPNAAVVPAALAMAQQLNHLTGADLLAAIALGADLVCRLGLALETNPESLGWYPPPILSTLGAATAAGRLARLTTSQMENAWSLALCQNSISTEFKRTADSTLRAVRDAFPAHAGWIAAALAQRGARGFDRPLEGEAGFFRLYAGNSYDTARLLRDAGSVFEGANVSYKPWPSCRGTHAFVEAAIGWQRDGLTPESVAQIDMLGGTVQQMLGEPLERKRAPMTAIDARFSAPYCVSAALLRGSLTLDSFGPAMLSDPQVLALARVATLSINRSSPSDFVAGTTLLRLRDGRVLQRSVTHPLGSPQQPLSERDLIAKFRDCAAHARRRLRPASEHRLIESVLHLEQVNDLESNLFTPLQDFEL